MIRTHLSFSTPVNGIQFSIIDLHATNPHDPLSSPESNDVIDRRSPVEGQGSISQVIRCHVCLGHQSAALKAAAVDLCLWGRKIAPLNGLGG